MHKIVLPFPPWSLSPNARNDRRGMTKTRKGYKFICAGLARNSEYEVLRFRANAVTSIVYKNGAGNISYYANEAKKAYRAFRGDGEYKTDARKTKKRLKSSKKEQRKEAVRERDGNDCFFKTKATALITNPPWQKQKSEGEIFNKLLRHWLRYFDGDIWLLFDADWIHTVQSFEFKEYCSLIVSVGRVSWLGNGVSGVDNCAWYKFNKNNAKPTEFCWPIGAHGRKEIKATLDLFDDT